MLTFNKVFFGFQDFETIHSVRSRIRNGTSKGAASGSAATTFPDILNGGANGEHTETKIIQLNM